MAAIGIGTVAAVYAGMPHAGLPVILLLVLGVTLLLFSTLTVRVTSGVLDVFFGPGFIRRRIDLKDIREVRIVRNPWYCGWGIRWIGRGWLWNVSGLQAVELELENGRRFRVGTDAPEALAEALQQ